MRRVGIPNPCVVQRSAVLFCVCLLLLSPWPVRFIPVVFIYSLYFNSCRIVFHCMNIPQCIFSFSYRWTFWVVINKTAMGILVRVLLWTSVLISLRYMQWCVGKCVTVSSLTKVALTCTVCKYRHHDQFQATKGMWVRKRCAQSAFKSQWEPVSAYHWVQRPGVEFQKQRVGIYLV